MLGGGGLDTRMGETIVGADAVDATATCTTRRGALRMQNGGEIYARWLRRVGAGYGGTRA